MLNRLKLENLTRFIIEFSERYHKVKSNLEEEERISSIYVKYKIATTYNEYKKSGKLLIQSKRGGAHCYMTPTEICADEEILSNMHPLDVNIVTKLKIELGERLNTSSIIKQWFCTEKGENIYLVYDSLSDNRQELCESKLLDSAHIVSRLSAQDCMLIGFDLGVKHNKRIANICE